MRRFLLFGLLGPPLGYAVLRMVLLRDQGFDIGELILLPLMYAQGLVPALAAAGFDHWLSRRGTRWRPLWTAAAASILGFIPVLTALVYLGSLAPVLLLWGMVGALPALVCSLLCGPSTGVDIQAN